MEFRVLGPLEIVASGESLALGGAKQRAVIALLVLHAPEPVAPDRIIDELWGDGPPASAEHAVQVYVSAFRKLLRSRDAAATVQISPSGYRLEVDVECIDARRAAQLLDGGQRALSSDPGGAQALLDEAVGLWRGPPLADLSEFGFARHEQARLEELQARTVECLIEARLVMGQHADVISSLSRLVESHPLREGPRRLQMLALYRSGRHAEALAVYRDVCAELGQVGLHPGPELRDLEASILRHDESLRAAHDREGREHSQFATSGDRAALGLRPGSGHDRGDANGRRSPGANSLDARRKVVTALCCEVTSSLPTASGPDPEALLELTSEYIDDLPAIVEHHGGRVTRLLGGGAVAVFGIPQVREDDALQAVRAAAAIRDHFDKLVAAASVPLGLRAAVHTGLVVVNHSGSVVLGDAVSIAGSLQQAAKAGEILVGHETLRLVQDAVEVEPLGRFAPKVEGQPMRAYRLISVETPAWMPKCAPLPFVGRERELSFIRAAWARCMQSGDCHLFTLLGAAGVGKSRLVEELLGELGDDVRLIGGRCLHYGDGITFWPIVEALSALGSEADSTLERISSGAAATPQEMFWEVQQVVEAAARERPMILCIDDLQWAEPMMLELLDHLVDYSRGVPILVLCVARPELIEDSPGWGGGKSNTTTILLEGLEQPACERLLRHLGQDLPSDVRSRVVSASGGNPLFLHELSALAADEGTVSVPPTIQALLVARLERLDSTEREILERAAVEGEIFHIAAVCEMVEAVEIGEARAQLARLASKQMVRAHPASLAGGEAFRFRHILIREAAYDGLAKATRARLHERFAGWLERTAHELSEFDELAGWHLEQAVMYGQELGRPVDRAVQRGAAMHLHAAGLKAAQRADTVAARKLLERAWSLASDDDALSPRIAVDLADALMEGGDLERIDELLKLAERDARTAPHAGLVRLHWLTIVRLDEAIETIEAVLPETLDRLEQAGDHSGLAKAHLVGYWATSQAARVVPSARHAALAAEHAREAGDDGLRAKALSMYIVSIVHGPMDVPTLREELDKIDVDEPGPYLAQLIQLGRAEVQRSLGDLDGARARFGGAIGRFREMGIHTIAAGAQDYYAWTELAGGEPKLALPGLVAIDGDLAATGDRAFRSTVQATLAQIYERLGDLDRARAAVELAEELTAPRDLLTVTLISIARARLALRESDVEAAERSARRAVDVATQTQMPFLQATARLELARVAAVVGRRRDARTEGLDALKTFEDRGDGPRAIWAREILDEIEGSATAQQPARA